jgi:hypothetical protein
MSEEQTKMAIQDYFQSFNSRDEEAMRARLHFPLIWIINNRVRLVLEAKDFVAPTKQMVRQDTWGQKSTRLDGVRPGLGR